MEKSNAETADSTWKSLYRIGEVATLITLIFYLLQLARGTSIPEANSRGSQP